MLIKMGYDLLGIQHGHQNHITDFVPAIFSILQIAKIEYLAGTTSCPMIQPLQHPTQGNWPGTERHEGMLNKYNYVRVQSAWPKTNPQKCMHLIKKAKTPEELFTVNVVIQCI